MTLTEWDDLSKSLLDNLDDWNYALKRALRTLHALQAHVGKIFNEAGGNNPFPGTDPNSSEALPIVPDPMQDSVEVTINTASERWLQNLVDWVEDIIKRMGVYEEGFKKGDNTKDAEARIFIEQATMYYYQYHASSGANKYDFN